MANRTSVLSAWNLLLCFHGLSTSETAANLPVWTDRKLIRIILHQGKKTKNEKGITGQGKLIVGVSFCLEVLLKFSMFERLRTWFGHIS